jgi:hypothetical protein
MNTWQMRAGYVALLIALLGAATTAAWFLTSPLAPRCQAADAASATAAIRLIDTSHHTSLLLRPSQKAGVESFTYTASDGTSYQGSPVQGLHPVAGDPLSCAGYLRVTYNGHAVRTSTSSSQTSAPPTTVQVAMTAIINLSHLTGVIRFSDQTDHLTFNTTTTAPPDLTQAITKSSQATTREDWATLYTMTSHMTVGDFTEQQFAAAMAQQEHVVGAITAITPTSKPTLITDQTGVTYFTVNERVTLVHNGATSELNVIAVYVLEDGVWKIWFTKTV